MILTPPKAISFWISVVLGLAGLLGELGLVALLAPYGFWLVFVGFVLLVLSVSVKGL